MADDLVPWVPAPTTVTTADEYTAAGQRRVAIKGFVAKVHAFWDHSVKATYAGYKAVYDVRQAFLEPAEQEDAALKTAMNAWLRAEDERRAREEAEAEAEARRRAEDALMAAALALAATAPDDETVQAQAASLFDVDPVDAPLAVASTVPKVAGLRSPTRQLTLTVSDKRQLVLAVGAQVLLDVLQARFGRDPKVAVVREFVERVTTPVEGLEFLDANVPALRRSAQRKQDAFKVPGVSVSWPRTV